MVYKNAGNTETPTYVFVLAWFGVGIGYIMLQLCSAQVSYACRCVKYLEAVITGIAIPRIAGKKDWGTYSIEGRPPPPSHLWENACDCDPNPHAFSP